MDEQPYCRECGSEELAYEYECASGRVFKCKHCGHTFQFDGGDDDDA